MGTSLQKGDPMSLRYNKIKNHPTTFHRLFGLSVDEFERIVKAVEPEWAKRPCCERTRCEEFVIKKGNN